MQKQTLEQMNTARRTQYHACNCIGPQSGLPVCPCRMKNVTERDGRLVETIDLGPAPKGDG